MTNEEEKILDEILEEEENITLEEAAEEALQENVSDVSEEAEEDVPDEGRAIEIPVERREDADLEEIRERPVLRDGGLRDAGHPEMIQTHMDNFLAKIAGETPVDDKPRNSTEFWLNEIAENLPGGGTTVVANPTLAGTEDPLTGLQVGDTKYSVGGAKKYLHRYSYVTTDLSLLFDVISEKSTQLTFAELRQLLISQGYTQANHLLLCTGAVHAWDSSITEGPVCGIRADTTYSSLFVYIYHDGVLVYSNTSIGALTEALITIIPLN